jgi:hypothetical protein
VEASSISYEEENCQLNKEDTALSELLGNMYGKKIWKIDQSGYCMVEAWDFASKLVLGKKYDGDYRELLKKALNELRQNPDLYGLVGEYEDELSLYESLRDYTKGAIVNVTNMKCTLIQVTSDGKECSLTLYPFNHDMDTEYVGPKIEIVFSRLRRHYDVVVDNDFNFNDFRGTEHLNNEGIFLFILNLVLSVMLVIFANMSTIITV